MKNLIKKILKESEDLEWAQDAVSGELRPTRSVVVDRQTSNPKNALEVHFEISFGDADYYERNTSLFYKNPGQYGYSFDDFERIVDFIKPSQDRRRIDFGGDEDFRELCYDVGAVGYSEMHDYSKKGYITNIYYYDENGNKFDARLT